MTRGYIRYRSKYKHQLASEYRHTIPIRPAADIVTEFIVLRRDGELSARAPSPKGDGFRRRLKSARPCRDSLFAYLETIVVLGHVTLELYVLRYHRIRHIARRRHEVTTGPKVTTPELLADRPKVAHQPMRRLALD